MDSDLQARLERQSIPEPNSGCWLWLGALGKNGYGTIGIGRRKMGAHRASYIAHIGQIPPGKVLLHRCDTKACVNPEHLSVGTHADNIADGVRKHPELYRNFSKVELKTRIEEKSVPEPNSGCWLWLGSTNFGYGELLVGGRKTLAHRIAYEEFIGEIPERALVLHKCHTRLCVNPDHLELGTHKNKNRARTTRAVTPKQDVVKDILKDRLDRLSVPEPNTGCQLWLGTVVKSTGYGEIKVDGRKTTAHRASWIANHGEIPEGLVVMHSCDVRVCINPAHLSLGTRKENSQDMARKGRGGFNRLTSEQRRERSQRAMNTLGPDGLRARAQKRVASTTPEQRVAIALKSRDTHRKNGWVVSDEQRANIAAGQAAARARGVRLGRPPTTITPDVLGKALTMRATGMTVCAIAVVLNVPKGALYPALQKRSK